MKRKALGKGISSLIPQVDSTEKLIEIDISRIEPSPFQPRRHFDEEKLAELAASIRNSGIIQPLVVARESDGRYTLIAGERRWRAAQLAGLTRVPAVVRDLVEEKKAEYALIENIQRQDLNPVEEAMAYLTLLEKFRLTQEQLSERLGKKRSTIANAIRILKLPEDVLGMVEDGQLSLGHAKVLTGLDDDELIRTLARQSVAKGWTVRALEKQLQAPGKQKKKPVSDVFLKDGAARLSKRLGTGVKITGTTNRGSIVIRYHSKDQLIALFDRLMEENK